MKEIGAFDVVGIIETLRIITMFSMYSATASLIRIHNVATTTVPYRVPLESAQTLFGAKQGLGDF